jgi:ATP-dependent DNA helicase Q1
MGLCSIRPDYKKLGVLKQQFPDIPLIALTATATTQVCRDMTSTLNIEGAELFRSCVNRPNLFYEVIVLNPVVAILTLTDSGSLREHM